MLGRLKVVSVVVAVGVLLAGCGLRGPITVPKEEAAPQTTATAESGQGKPEGTAQKPHKGFILDPLLR